MTDQFQLFFVLLCIRNIVGIFADNLLHVLCLVFAFWYAKVRDDMDVDALVIEIKQLKNISSSFAPDTFETVRDVSKALTPTLTHGHRKDFFPRRGISGFFLQVTIKVCPGGSKNDVISFFLPESKENDLFC